MKYEPVFGDQSLFDDAPEDAEMAATVCQMPRWYTMFNGKVLFCDSKKESWKSADFNHPGSPLLAMRRIIAEPNRWTVADQKAGRLLEVGCKVDTIIGECMIIGADLNLKHVAVQYHDGYMDILHISKIKPIETPEEKAQREEDEFVKLMIDLASESQLMSCGFKDGVIAAYRKLKGGE